MATIRRNFKWKDIVLSFFLIFATKELIKHNKDIWNKQIILEQKGVTLVTGYFNLSSKHPHEEYLLWMDSLMRVKDNMVIYTHDWMIPIMKNYSTRRENNTRFIAMDIKDAIVANKYPLEDWQEQIKIDHEAWMHRSIETYWVWNEKVNMVKEVTDSNPFNSQYFLWVDIGYLRTSGGRYQYKTWVQRPKFHSTCVLLLVVDDFTGEDLVVDETGMSNVSFNNPKSRIAAGAWGGTSSAISLWHHHYYNTLDQYHNQGRFFGNEQAIMATTCVQHPDICCLVTPPKDYWNPWFWFDPLLAGTVQSPIYKFTRP